MSTLQEITSELELRRAIFALSEEGDEALELAIRDRATLVATIERLLAILARHAEAPAVWIRTWDEDLMLRDFSWPANTGPGFDVDAVHGCCEQLKPYLQESAEEVVIGQHLDVAGEFFGSAAVRLDGVADEARRERVRALLQAWCQELDNFISSVALARRKHHVTRAVSEALKHPLLDLGISEAITALAVEVPIDDLLLLYRHEDDLESLNYRVIIDGTVQHCSFSELGLAVDPEVLDRMKKMLLGEDSGLPAEFGIGAFREEVLINGIRDQRVIGRLIVSRRGGEFNTFDRDLLECFADFLRQRIVEFNREWQVLSQGFPRHTVVRLLREVDYAPRFLEPREREVAILFSDISGFTRVSEQVLGEPVLIGELIDSWSEGVVRIVWEHGGVFDKMVGDCIIAHWGPPFYDWDPSETCARAAAAALRIREFTHELGSTMPRLRDMGFPFGVATGLNYCPLFVGRFGPDQDFTGFSSGMNNTARLQGVAHCDDILCMDRFVNALAQPDRFGEGREATVKNVAAPLPYRALLT